MELVLASTNKGKIIEIQDMLKGSSTVVRSLKDVGIVEEIPEDGTTFAENAYIKAKAVHDLTKLPTLADDSGIVVDFMNGEPGILSARFAPVGERQNTILRNLAGVPYEQRSARFVCVMCFIGADNVPHYAEGVTEGHIATKKMGTNGFGYDSIFLINETTTTAMITEEEKNAISHRGKAMAGIKKWIELEEKRQ